ncbi:flagellin [Ferrimonas sp. SCSIO 43195]|uniref:flagellin N-terminal helical domain-containing protein n=1 Tax=Ferrimonas sp. SCSIO 43195 TaxID=2822844 RepID=UPI0020760A59|nr:flagellin [Ferrimonas sp. SCSIO 43195]USD39031.1 Lateral flagellin [Ferrimonas sp. SCSIO 43195]
MLSVQTNFPSLVAQNSVGQSNNGLNTAMERLSTGFRINSAADDAAGLQIANRLNANVTGMNTAQRNIGDATSMLQTADGALDEVNDIAMRMKELATQASNGVNSADDLKALNAEFGELKTEIARIQDDTTYAGNKLFDTLKTGVKFQIGAGAGEELETKLDTGTVKVKDAVTKDLDTQANAKLAMAEIDTLIKNVGTHRSDLGADINRLEHTSNNLANVSQNTTAAAGRIMDADFAAESAAMTKNQLLVQSGTNILSRANQNTNLVMGLLG